MTDQIMAPIEILRITGQQTAHKFSDIGFGCLDQKMKMIWHEAPPEKTHSRAVCRLEHHSFKTRIVCIVQKDALSTIPPVIYVIESSFKLNSWRSGHDATSYRLEPNS